MTELSIHELSLGFSHDRQMLVEFLAKHHLNCEDVSRRRSECLIPMRISQDADAAQEIF